MSLVLRGQIGRRLSIAEMDGNFTYLQQLALSGTTSNISNYTEVTYSDLKSSIDSSVLNTGSYYLITDFKTCYDQPDYDIYGDPITEGNYKVGNTHSILVFATSENTISTDAWQPDFPKDRIKYDYSWTQSEVTSGTAYGRITERIDEWNNRTDYDHRDILFRRYDNYYYKENDIDGGTIELIENTGEVIGTGTTFSNYEAGDIIAIPSTDQIFFEIVNIDSDTSMGVTGLSIPAVSDVSFYSAQKDGLTYKQNNISIEYTEHPTFLFDDETIISNYIGDVASFIDWGENTFLLPNNVFGEDVIGNRIGNEFINNTFNSDVEHNVIGDEFKNNTIYNEEDFADNQISANFSNNLFICDDFNDNVIGDNFDNNKFFNNIDFIDNQIGVGFSDNTIYNDFEDNKINNGFHENVIDGNFNNNQIGNQFNSNNIYRDFYQNRIFNYFNNNDIYDDFDDNFIDNGFENNTIGSADSIGNYDFQGNKIGYDSKGNFFRGYVYDNILGHGFYSNDVHGDFNGNVFGSVVIFNTFGTNSQNNNIGNFFISNDIGEDFINNHIQNSFSDNNISFNFSYNEIGNNFYNNNIENDFGFGGDQSYGNKIGNYFENNTIGEYFYGNVVTDIFNNNTVGSYFRFNDAKIHNLGSYDFTIGYNNIISFTDNTGASPSIPGTDNVYTGLTVSGGSGSNATFDVTVSGSIVTDVSLNNSGTEYQLTDVLTIPYQSFGGTAGLDIEITVGSVSATPHVYQIYNCTLFRNASATYSKRLSYYDENDVLNIESLYP